MIKKTVYYIGGYEKEIRDNHIYHRIQIGDVAIVEKVDDNAESIHYTLRDHLGSLIATVSDTGTIKRLFYDPWGKRLNLPVLEAQPITLFDLASFLTPRGFTGHEHLDNVGLIHMNGRVYDPEIARFVSADPFIQDPTYLQSYNRYAYTWNNPLRMTDPSGYWSLGLDKLLGVAEVVVGGVLLYGSGGANPWGHALLGDGLRRLDNPSDKFGFSLQYQDTLGKNNNQSGSGSSSTSESTSDSGSTSGSGSLTESSDGSYSYNLGYGDGPSGYYGNITPIEQTPWQYAMVSSMDAALPIAAIAAASDGPIPAGDIVGGAILVGAFVTDLSVKTHVTYLLINKVGQTYVGRASGYGDPISVMNKRFSNHHMMALGFGNPMLDKFATGLSGKVAIRGREQQMINFLGGVGSSNVGNRIRGVSTINPLGRAYHNASSAAFGEIAKFDGYF